MSILNKKIVRPCQELGKNNKIKWYTDNNQIEVHVELLIDFEEFVGDIPFGPSLPNFKRAFQHDGYVSIDLAIKYLDMDTLCLLLVYLELPETVEAIVISKYKEIQRQKNLLQDKVNLKRKKVLEFK